MTDQTHPAHLDLASLHALVDTLRAENAAAEREIDSISNALSDAQRRTLTHNWPRRGNLQTWRARSILTRELSKRFGPLFAVGNLRTLQALEALGLVENIRPRQGTRPAWAQLTRRGYAAQGRLVAD